MGEGTIRIGAWDCASCGKRGVAGYVYACPGCGHPRPDDVVFYLPGDAPVVTDAAAVAEALAGADWICRYCGNGNGAKETTCAFCGAAREGASPELAVGSAVPSGEVARSGEEARSRREERRRRERAAAARSARAPGRRRRLHAAAFVALLGVVLGVGATPSSSAPTRWRRRSPGSPGSGRSPSRSTRRSARRTGRSPKAGGT